jgi:uncharacterized membrane protein YraQ (UPF0718 family)
MKTRELYKPVRKALNGIIEILPILMGVLLLVSIVTVMVPKSFYAALFNGNLFRDSLTGSLLGSLLAGNPVTAYILGSGFLQNGVSIIAVTAFIAAWTTVGVVQLPAEAMILGKKFAFSRNISAFILSILVAISTFLIMAAI